MSFVWSAEKVAELRRRWIAQETASRIGLALGTTKDAVVNKVRRLDLEGRPSPIRPKGAGHPVPKVGWSADMDSTLRRLWASGVVSAQIGVAVGRSCRQVYNRAAQLSLPSRKPGFQERLIRAEIAAQLIADAQERQQQAQAAQQALIAQEAQQALIAQEAATAVERREVEAARLRGHGALPAGHPITWGAISPHRGFNE